MAAGARPDSRAAGAVVRRAAFAAGTRRTARVEERARAGARRRRRRALRAVRGTASVVRLALRARRHDGRPNARSHAGRHAASRAPTRAGYLGALRAARLRRRPRARRRRGEEQGRGWQQLGRRLAADLTGAVAALLAALGAGRLAIAVAADRGRTRGRAIRRLRACLGTRLVRRVHADPADAQARLQGAGRRAANLATARIALGIGGTPRRTFARRRADGGLVNGAALRGRPAAVRVCLAELEPLPRGGANLLRAGYERPVDAGLTHHRVALRVARTEDRTRRGGLTDLAARPVVAAKLAHVRVAVVVHVAGLVTRGEADPRAVRAAGPHGSGCIVAAVARTPAGPRDGDADRERKGHTFGERRECHCRKTPQYRMRTSRSPSQAGPFRPNPEPRQPSMNTLALRRRLDIEASTAE